MNEINQTQYVPTLSASDYHCSSRYADELNAIFNQQWIYVLHASQLPDKGSYETFNIADKPILISCGADDVIRAFYNVCVHRGHILVQGSGTATHFTCPYHAWTYHFDGRLRGAPGVPHVADLPECNQQLVGIETRVTNGFVFVRLNPGADDFEQCYGKFFGELGERLPALDQLRFAKRFVAEVDGNWKIMVENYLECYHCTPTHEALSDLMCIKDYQFQQSEYYLSTWAPAGRPDNKAYAYTLNEGSQRKFSGWWLWPNTTFNIFPGQQNLLVFHMLPLSSERSIGYCDYFFIDGKVDEEAEALMDWEGNVLEKEDNDLIVSAHKGMKSNAIRNGVFVIDGVRQYISEGPLAHFNQLIQRTLDGAGLKK
ncbi:aromatic ring-hydroxylating dioxygenase subunit alpha [Phyllobacterium sp. SB3]|uniref:aromatic ring-hydroxylating oxygenase subunit alpha n=1 Tax=Phyllobacterium sp. SB3 TaxID=3156073 RepID=UPI0032B01CF7